MLPGTGASSGLGEQLARSLVAHGARPVLAARRADRLRALDAELAGAAHTIACDVTDEAGRQRLIETVLDAYELSAAERTLIAAGASRSA